jgi:hypothetical protein
MSETPVDPPEPDAEDTEPQQDRFEQYPHDHPLVKRLEAMKAELKETKPKAKRLAELEEAAKSDAEKAADRIAAESARADTAEAALLRYEVAADLGMPSHAVKFLTGATRDEMVASGKEIMELIGEAGKPRAPKPDPNQGRTPPDATTPQSQFAAFLQDQLNNS